MVMMSQIPGEFGIGGGTGSDTGGSSSGRVGPPMNALRLFDPDAGQRARALDIEVRWSYIEKSVKSGQVAVGAKIGQTEVSMGGQTTTYDVGEDTVFSSSSLVLKKQIGPDTYEEIEVFGLQYTNWVYDGKTVVINAHDAFYEKDEEGFIIPLNQEVLQSMSLRHVTQLSYECTHIVLNCYQVVKKKWYQKGWFKVLLIIVAIVITALTWGADGGTSLMAALSMNAAVALGFTGIMAVWVAATFTVLASMILMNLLTAASTKLFGEAWGQVIAAVAMMFTMGVGASGSLQGGFTALTSAPALMNMSMAVLNGYAAHTQIKAGELQTQMQTQSEEYTKRMEEIEKLAKETLGTNLDQIDLLGFQEAAQVYMEAADTFLARTLMTGSDVAGISLAMIEGHADIGLRLPNT